MNASRNIAAEYPHAECCPAAAMSYVPWHQWEDIYNPDEAHGCGTVFPSLNLPFTVYCRKTACRKEHCKHALLLEHVQQLGFMTDDIQLFLNTHPDCEEALRALRYYLAAERNARAEYEAHCGSLTLEGLANCSRYDWIHGAWPWETEG